MLGQGTASAREVLEGLTTTGHFLAHHLAPDLGDRPLPASRARLIAMFERHFAT